jgi:hypothetical protein
VPWSGTGIEYETGKEKRILALLDAESKERQERGLAAPFGEQEIETQHRLANQEGVQAETATKKNRKTGHRRCP